MSGNTEPPCKACDAHDELEKELRTMKKNNTEEHGDIMTSIEVMAANINWMNIIGKWILVTLLGYFIAIGYFIFSNDWVEQKELDKVTELVRHGEILHYQNEKVIEGISTKLSIVIDHINEDKD